MLTTITPYWGRPEMLRTWIKAIQGATLPEIRHCVIFVGEPVPDWLQKEHGLDPKFHFISCVSDVPGMYSIGHYHNMGARLACTLWIMKMDVDTIPNVRYFRELLPLLKSAAPQQWFNGGMVYICEHSSHHFLNASRMPLSEAAYNEIMCTLKVHCGNRTDGPAATNFICRVKDYLRFGGCDERFRGYGWEDYQQIYMLERQFSKTEPLPGLVTFENVTRRCREELSRAKARALTQRSPWLCLLHHHHSTSTTPAYKSAQIMQHNKRILFESIQRARLC